MRYLLVIYLLTIFYVFGYSQTNKTQLTKLKPIKKTVIKIPEPSDICVNTTETGFYIVSDNGYLYETDLNGKVLKKADYRGADFEAVWVNTITNEIMVSDESLRRFEVFNTDLTHLRTYTIAISAGRNEGIESGTFYKAKAQHIVFTEKNPAELLTFPSDIDRGKKTQYKIEGIQEVSACTFYANYLWVLSDEKRIIYKVDYPNNKKIVTAYSIPILNPEGLCFLKDGSLVVVSDDLEKLFFFTIP